MIVSIVGPTGVGKTKLAIALAKRFDGEIVSADSVQIYKGLDIGSAKASPAEQKEVSHHLLDLVEPSEEYSVANFQKDARAAFEDIQKRGKLPFLVGGTGFYQKSVLHDFRFENTYRDKAFEAELANYENTALYEKLKKTDPKAASNIHPNNRKRLLHALSRAKRENPIGEEARGERKLYDYVMIALHMPREALHRRIEERVETMFEEGLLAEAVRLYHQRPSKAEEAIGYKECFAYLDGRISLEEAKKRIVIHSRQYAKRQYTYFKNQFDAHWLSVEETSFEKTVEEAASIIERKCKNIG